MARTDVKAASGARAVQRESVKLFLGGLTRNTTTKMLREHFSTYGRILDCVAMVQPDGKPRGFGYVTLDSSAAAERVLSEPQVVDNRHLDVKLAVPGANQLTTGRGAKTPTAAAQSKGSDAQPRRRRSEAAAEGEGSSEELDAGALDTPAFLQAAAMQAAMALQASAAWANAMAAASTPKGGDLSLADMSNRSCASVGGLSFGGASPTSLPRPSTVQGGDMNCRDASSRGSASASTAGLSFGSLTPAHSATPLATPMANGRGGASVRSAGFGALSPADSLVVTPLGQGASSRFGIMETPHKVSASERPVAKKALGDFSSPAKKTAPTSVSVASLPSPVKVTLAASVSCSRLTLSPPDPKVNRFCIFEDVCGEEVAAQEEASNCGPFYPAQLKENIAPESASTSKYPPGLALPVSRRPARRPVPAGLLEHGSPVEIGWHSASTA